MSATNDEEKQINSEDIVEPVDIEADNSASEPSNNTNPNNTDENTTEEGTNNIEKAIKEASDNWEKYLRTHAELENLRKRHDKDIEKARKYSIEQFCKEMLSVKDSMELGLQATKEAQKESIDELIKGSELTLKMLNQTFDKYAIKEINPIGEKFNPDFHQAMTMQASDSVEDNHIITVFQKGYTLNDRLIRPALVVVAQN